MRDDHLAEVPAALEKASEAASALSLSAVEVVAITRAPSTLANCSAKTETPPEPCVRTVSPAVTRRWPVSATQAVTAVRGLSLDPRMLRSTLPNVRCDRFSSLPYVIGRDAALTMGGYFPGQWCLPPADAYG